MEDGGEHLAMTLPRGSVGGDESVTKEPAQGDTVAEWFRIWLKQREPSQSGSTFRSEPKIALAQMTSESLI